MSLISVGVDHEHASLAFLERATVPEHQWSKVLRDLVSRSNIHEAVFVSTCLRTEVVAVIDLFHGAIDEITETIAEVTGLATEDFADRLTVHFDRGVPSHLFAVAAGLHSVVPGEFEVLGQLRRALELAVEEQTAGHELDELFHRALASGRRVRAETTISRGTTSFAQAAVSLAVESLGAELAGAEVTVIGAGQLATGVVKGLLEVPGPISRLRLLNRTPERAAALAAALDDARVTVDGLDALDEALATARLVVTALETPAPLVGAAHLAARDEPVMIIDLGVPRAVADDVDALAHVVRVDIGDLRDRVARALGGRHDALDAARELVHEDVERYLADQRARGAASIVRDLRSHLDEVVEAELARRANDLADLSDPQREVVQSLVRSVVAKIAHRPTVTLKDAAGTDRGTRLTEATRTLFDL